MDHLIGDSLGKANWKNTELKDRDFILVIRLEYRYGKDNDYEQTL